MSDLRAYGEACAKALEEAVNACDRRTHHDLHVLNDRSVYWEDKRDEGWECAAAIRALSGKP